MSRRALRPFQPRLPRTRHLRALPLTMLLAATLLVASCRAAPDHLTYDQDGVAQEVLAMIPFNTRWAQDRLPDAVLYRIELRHDAPADSAPAQALYSFYSPRRNAFLTASSDPVVPWSGAEPLDWPAGKPAPFPLPPVKMDFREAWRLAAATGIYQVSSAVLEVNQRNGVPIVAWTVTGRMADLRERGVYFDALSGDRMYAHTLFDPPSTHALVETAISTYRGTLREDVTQDPNCPTRYVPVPARKPVTCFDAVRGVYASYAGKR